MSEHHAEHDAHSSHHVSPTSLYLSVWGGLMVLTVITVLAYYIPIWLKVDLGAANVIIAMAIATTKASLVVLYFMGLKYDKRFLAVAFLSSLIFLALFLGFTLLDINTREDSLPFAKPVYVPKEVPAAGGHSAGAPATDTKPAGAVPATGQSAASPGPATGQPGGEMKPAASAAPSGAPAH